MLVTHDLICEPCATALADCIYDPKEPPRCFECGGSLVILWSSPRRFRPSGDGSFVPITLHGEKYSTRSEWESYKRALEKNTGLRAEEVSHSASVGQERADTLFHRAYEKYKARGLTWEDAQRRMKMEKRKAQEQRERGGR